jgi:anti-sigma regulatory factor (Ser/Thr protein kinase)
MTANRSATDSVLLAAVGAVENVLEVVGRHYTIKLQPRALVSCRFPFVTLSGAGRTFEAGGDVTGVLRRLPEAVQARADAWLPVLQDLGDAVEVLNSTRDGRLLSEARSAARLHSVYIEPLAWMGGFPADSDSDPVSHPRTFHRGVDLAEGIRAPLGSGGHLVLRMVDGSGSAGPLGHEHATGECADAIEPKGEKSTVIDIFGDLHGVRKGARKTEIARRVLVAGSGEAVYRSSEDPALCAFVHDIKNVLMLVSGNLELQQQRGGERCDRALSAAQAGVALAREYLQSMQRTPAQQSTADSNEALSKAAELAAGVLDSNVTVELSLADSRRLVKVDALGLKRALFNLIINAKDALPGGGQIAMSTRHVGDNVEFRVTDNGTGIPEPLLSQVCDPFFTTKQKTGGTGLGLHLVREFVEAAGGRLSIESKEMRGTSVCLTLPSVPATVTRDE